MPLWTGFIGGAGTSRSTNFAADQLINAFVEPKQTQGSAKEAWLFGTPGLTLFQTAPEVVGRGCFSQDNRTFTVIGPTLYEADPINSTLTVRGRVANDGTLCSFATNGRGGEQLALVSAGRLYIFGLTTNTFTGPVGLPLTFAPVTVLYFDGYFLLLERNTIRVWFSTLENGLLWSALDFFAVSISSDNNIGMELIHNRLWLHGSQTTKIYYDSGDALNPFIPYPGAIMQEGATTPYGNIVLGESVFWLSQDNQGRRRMVVATSDAAAQRISTAWVENDLATYSTVADAEVLAYEQEGHSFVAWTFPSAETTWVYDATTQTWHQRFAYDPETDTFVRWYVRGLCSTDQGLLVGDYRTGALYFLDLNAYTDNGDTIKRVRRCPYLSAENQWLFLDQIELGAETGVGNTAEPDPQVMIRLSRDSAHTFDPIVPASLGLQGQYDAVVRWYQMGRARADRLVGEVSMTDPVKMAWGPGLWLRITPGSGQN